MDIWDSNFDPSFTHTVTLGGATAVYEVPELFVAGLDLDASLTLDLNGTFLGIYVEPTDLENRGKTVTFVVPIAALMDGLNALNVTASNSSDGYIIDCTELRIATDMCVVPGPATIALIGLGLVGLRYRRQNSTN